MALKFLGADGTGKGKALLAMEYSMAMGASITSHSWSTSWPKHALRQALKKGKEEYNQLHIASAGNNGRNLESMPFSYPCLEESTLCVAMMGKTGYWDSHSNYGSRRVAVAAPGVDILSTIPGGKYMRLTGTSMACPHVSGIAALVWGRLDWFPEDPSFANRADRLFDLIPRHVQKSWKWETAVSSGGVANAYNIIASLGTPPETPPTPTPTPAPTPAPKMVVWVEAEASKTCDEACSMDGRECDEESFQGHSRPAMESLAESLYGTWTTSYSYMGVPCFNKSSGMPFVTKEQQCNFDRVEVNFVQGRCEYQGCSAAAPADSYRLCPCWTLASQLSDHPMVSSRSSEDHGPFMEGSRTQHIWSSWPVPCPIAVRSRRRRGFGESP
jgi:hypothetical protein